MNTLRSFVSSARLVVSKGIWKALAFLIVLLIAGPELMIGMELIALIEVLGASTFVIAYYASIKVLLTNLKNKYLSFERYTVLFIPSWQQFRQMPSLCLHAIPHRTVIISLFSTVYLGMFFILI
ncbi:hypothetical protein Q4489_10845 [Thalassotalea sp. 1_MG-2023]|uniref:hypothetical protein n=1 Tax=Thalassotalea sp. 1_MG-2023 TaxID=3062680 RepID=UPI0026E3B641|nr:hypothetical protein [Thalassotalea sp. 1_MG-2023]MDO6427516.1 hypothetical protein [Thalassotalea sp. 1_MG-2023]